MSKKESKLEEFMRTLGKIEHLESCDSYGHYPFSLLSETQEGTVEMASLALGGSPLGVIAYYKTFKDSIEKGHKTVSMTTDFPAGGDIEDDFVLAFGYTKETDTLEVIGKSYSLETGEVSRTLDVHNSTHLVDIAKQLKGFLDS